MNAEFVVFLIGAFLTGVIFVWMRFRAIDRQLRQMHQEINELRWMESRLFMLGMSAPIADLDKGAARQDTNTDVGSTSTSPPANS
jgi:hypothetical protein